MSIEDLKARYAEPQTNGTPMETESQGSETEGKYYTSSIDLSYFIFFSYLIIFSFSASLECPSHTKKTGSNHGIERLWNDNQSCLIYA